MNALEIIKELRVMLCVVIAYQPNIDKKISELEQSLTPSVEQEEIMKLVDIIEFYNHNLEYAPALYVKLHQYILQPNKVVEIGNLTIEYLRSVYNWKNLSKEEKEPATIIWKKIELLFNEIEGEK